MLGICFSKQAVLVSCVAASTENQVSPLMLVMKLSQGSYSTMTCMMSMHIQTTTSQINIGLALHVYKLVLEILRCASPLFIIGRISVYALM